VFVQNRKDIMLLLLLGIVILHVAALVLLFVSTIVSVSIYSAVSFIWLIKIYLSIYLILKWQIMW